VDNRGCGPVVRFRFRVGAWDNTALVDFARYALRTEVISSPVGLVPTNASACVYRTDQLPDGQLGLRCR